MTEAFRLGFMHKLAELQKDSAWWNPLTWFGSSENTQQPQPAKWKPGDSYEKLMEEDGFVRVPDATSETGYRFGLSDESKARMAEEDAAEAAEKARQERAASEEMARQKRYADKGIKWVGKQPTGKPAPAIRGVEAPGYGYASKAPAQRAAAPAAGGSTAVATR